MADTITLTFKVAEDGSLKAIGQDAERTAKSTDKATKASNNYNKGAKGVGQAGLSASKGFSKMRSEIGGGGSGLVGAYAGLAANVFALTAAFGALSRASRANQLEEGLVSLGQASGLAMHTLSRGLVEATGNAVSLEEAMRSVALITSAGIDPGSIERFGNVARGAATALGRDVNDAISRLTRGITKLEPELLDELGIMVRLDEASKAYADSVNKSVSDLTRYEKSQAFLNATLEEGERKFGALAEVDVNVFDKLSASLANLLKGGLGGLSSMIEPIVGYLASSPTALIGVLAAFGATISGAIVGSLADMAESATNATNATISMSATNISAAAGLNTTSNTLKNYVTTLEEGGDVMGAYTAAVDGQVKSMVYHNGVNLEGGYTLDQFNTKKKNAKIITDQLGMATQQHALAQTQDSAATAQLAFAQGNLAAGLKGTWATLKGVGTTMKVSILTTTSFKTALSGLAISAKATGVAFKTMGAGVMAMLGPLGIAFTVLSLLWDAMKGLINMFKSDETKAYEEKTKALADAQKELAANLQEVDDAFAGSSNKIFGVIKTYEALDNVLGTFQAKYKDLAKAGNAAEEYGEQKAAQTALIQSSEFLMEKLALYKIEHAGAYAAAGNDIKKQVKITQDFIDSQKGVSGAVTAVGAASKGAKEGIQDFLNSQVIKTDLDLVLGGLTDLRKAFFTTVEKTGELVINPNLVVDGKFGTMLNEAITGDMAITYGLTQQKAALAAVDAERTKALESQAKAQATLDNITTTYMGKVIKLHGVRQEDFDTATKALAKEKEGFKEKEKLVNQEAQGIIELIAIEETRVAVGVQRIVTEKTNLSIAKVALAVAKENSAHTVASLTARQKAEKDNLTIQLDAKTAAQTDLNILINRLRTQQKKEKLSVDNAKLLLSYTRQEELLVQDILLLEAQQNTVAEDALETATMHLKALGESQKASKLLLGVKQKILKEDRTQLSLQLKLVQLSQKMENRKTGATDTKSQVLAINLDKDVVKQKIAFIAREAVLKAQGVKMEHTLNLAKMKVLREEIRVINAKRKEGNKIATNDLDSMIAEMAGNGGLLEEQLESIALNAQVLTQELGYQVSTTNLIALATAERLKHQQSVLALTQEESKVRMGMRTSMQDIKEMINTIAQNENTDLFGDPRSVQVAAKLSKEANLLKVQTAQLEISAAQLSYELDMSVIQLKFRLLQAEMEADGQRTQNEADILNANQRLIDAKSAEGLLSIEQAKQKLGLVQSEVELANRAALGAAASQGFAAVINTAIGQGEAKLKDAEEKAAVESSKEFKKAVLDGFDASQGVKLTNEILGKIYSAMPGVGPDEAGVVGNPPPVAVATARDMSEEGSDYVAKTMQEELKTVKVDEVGFEAPKLREDGTNIDIKAPVIAEPASTPLFKPSEGGIMSDLPSIDLTRAALQGVATDMAALGPDGAGPAQMVAGLATMTTAFDDTKSAGERIGAAISGVASIVAGAAQNKVASIDKEIEAEKKRDGKSKGSIAKIKALEKKKEAVERKAFNTKKKLNMAQVITSTATAIMKESEKGFPAAIPGIAMFGAMGAAQLAVISGMTYSGGGSSASAAAPTSLNVGERNNTVDLAKGNNAAGELGYMRGESGVGTGATNFKPKGAFSGYKHRGAGGYVVGEQGPELFMPETPGEIIPSGKGGGAPTNVNFNISAIDASGVEDVLIRQKGHIISMIREAANEHGQPFLEGINTDVYTNTNEVK